MTTAHLPTPAAPCRVPLILVDSLAQPLRAGSTLLALPFDALRAQYADAVQAGWVRRSLLASARVEHLIDGLERLVLGPLARRV